MRAGDLWTKERVSEGGEEGWEGDSQAEKWGVEGTQKKENILEFQDINIEIKVPKRRGGRKAILFCHLGGS